jgi:hypothetical protein
MCLALREPAADCACCERRPSLKLRHVNRAVNDTESEETKGLEKPLLLTFIFDSQQPWI